MKERVHRSVLLPPYLSMNQYFVEYTEAIDEVFGPNVDQKLRALQNIRNMWVVNPVIEQRVVDHRTVDLSEWTKPERELLVKQVNLLGMKLKSAGVLTDDDYLMVSRFVGQYWFGKGTQAFVEFINFCLNVDLRVHRLWAEDEGDEQYHKLTREGDFTGNPIWEGGNWYPTTHVELEAVGGLGDLTNEVLAEFFYEIANFNLVLAAIDSSFQIPIVGNPYRTDTAIVAMGVMQEVISVMSTEGRYGADAPPSNDTEGFTLRQFGTQNILIAAPSGWFLDLQGRSVMVFDPMDMTTQELSAIPMKMIGEPVDPDLPEDPTQYTILTAPTGWSRVPGSSRSTARIPVWSTTPSASVRSSVPTRIIGRPSGYVSNPKGWIEISPGNFTPYW